MDQQPKTREEVVLDEWFGYVKFMVAIHRFFKRKNVCRVGVAVDYLNETDMALTSWFEENGLECNQVSTPKFKCELLGYPPIFRWDYHHHLDIFPKGSRTNAG